MKTLSLNSLIFSYYVLLKGYSQFYFVLNDIKIKLIQIKKYIYTTKFILLTLPISYFRKLFFTSDWINLINICM